MSRWRIRILNFTYNSSVGNCTNATITNGTNKVILESGVINDTGKYVRFSTNDIPNNTLVYVLLLCTNRSMKSSSSPLIGTAFNYSQTFVYTNDYVTFSTGANEFEQIENIGFSNYSTMNTSFYYDLFLSLNGTLNQNITWNYADNINISGNLTGNLSAGAGQWNLSLYINNSFNKSGINAVSDIYNFSNGGLIPITLNFGGNATLPSYNITYYLNISTPAATPTPSSGFTYNFDLNSAPLTCANSTWAQRNATIDGVVHQEVYPCPFGCENSGCKLDPIYQGFISFGLLCLFVLILLGLDKVLKR